MYVISKVVRLEEAVDRAFELAVRSTVGCVQHVRKQLRLFIVVYGGRVRWYGWLVERCGAVGYVVHRAVHTVLCAVPLGGRQLCGWDV